MAERSNLPTDFVNPIAEALVQYGPAGVLAVFLGLSIWMLWLNRGQRLRDWQREAKAIFWIGVGVAVLMVPVFLFVSLSPVSYAYSGMIRRIPSSNSFQSDKADVYFLHRTSEVAGYQNVYWIYYSADDPKQTGTPVEMLYRVKSKKEKIKIEGDRPIAAKEEIVDTYECKDINFSDSGAHERARFGRLSLDVERDPHAERKHPHYLVAQHDHKVRFTCQWVPPSPDDEPAAAVNDAASAPRDRSRSGGAPAGLFASALAQDRLPPAAAYAPLLARNELERMFLSDNRNEVRKAGEILAVNAGHYRPLIVAILSDDASSRTMREAAMVALRRHFAESDLAYPNPEELRFLSADAIQRVVLDGLDAEESIGSSARRLLNSLRDRRVEEEFSRLRRFFRATASPAFVSCFAAFEMSVYVNWAALSLQRKIAQPGASIEDALRQSEAWLAQAESLRPLATADEDAVQFARIDYTRGTILLDSIEAQTALGSRTADPAKYRSRADSAFRTFLERGRDRAAAWQTYRFSWHVELAAEYVKTADAAIFKRPVLARPLPERSCELDS